MFLLCDIQRYRMIRLANTATRVFALFLLLTCFSSTPLCPQEKSPPEIIDYHQHLYSPEAGARSSPEPKGIDADDLVAQLDAAGIEQAVVLSVAYDFSNPNNHAFLTNTRRLLPRTIGRAPRLRNIRTGSLVSAASIR
jgi:hypothetical protein